MKLEASFTMLVSGPSGSGKTSLIKDIILQRAIEPPPQRIYWLYAEDQPLYKELPNVIFIRGIPENFETLCNAKYRNLVIIDDLMTELHSDQRLTRMFSVGSHHKNMSLVFIVHNLFHSGREMRNISLNSHYICLFKNPRDSMQVATLARQMYPGRSQFLVEAYKEATKRPYGYLLIDLKPTTPEILRLRTNLLGTPVVYVHKEDSTDLTDVKTN